MFRPTSAPGQAPSALLLSTPLRELGLFRPLEEKQAEKLRIELSTPLRELGLFRLLGAIGGVLGGVAFQLP